MTVKVYHVYCPTVRLEDQVETLAFISGLKADPRFTVYDRVTPEGDPYAYYNVLHEAYRSHTRFIVLEQDIVPSVKEDLIRLFNCDLSTVCVAPYLIYPASTALPEPVYAHRKLVLSCGYRWVRRGEDWADLWGLGLVKISSGGFIPVDPVMWNALDTRLSYAYLTLGVRAHVHWDVDVKHNHAG